MPVVTKRVKTVRATHPNAGVTAWYLLQIEDALAQMYLELTMQLGVAFVMHGGLKLHPEVNPAKPVLRLAADATPTKIDKIMQSWARKWSLKFDKMSLTISKRFATRSLTSAQASMNEAFKRAGFTVKFRPTVGSINAYKSVIAENVNLIKSIPQEFLTNVQSSVWSSVRAGGDMGTLSRQLRKNYDVTVKRAALISRDQNAKATAVIENTRRQELGITQAIWQHSSAGKEPRPTHVAMDGKLFDLRRGMWDSDENAFVYPGQLINCRCTSRAVIPGFGE